MEGAQDSVSSASGKTFCSLVRRGRPELKKARNLEQCLGLVVHILAKEILCSHDVEDLTWACRQISLLEKEASLRSIVCERITSQFRTRITHRYRNGQDLISLYFLSRVKNFEGKSFLQEEFEWHFRKVDKKTRESLVHDLPVCFSQEVYRKNIQFVLGTIDEGIVARKSGGFAVFSQREERVKKTKEEYAQKVKLQPERYSSYLVDLIGLGYLELCEHILRMQELQTSEERLAFASQMSFQEIAQIVLQTREAILTRVQSQLVPGSIYVILIGDSGVGKSTSLCFLRGDTMRLDQDGKYHSQEDGEIIGQKDRSSQTFLPNLTEVENITLIDFPGFNDTKGPIVSMGMELALKALARKYRPKILFLCSIQDSGLRLATVLAPKVARVRRILGGTANCLLGFTHYTQYKEYLDLQEMEKAQRNALSSPSSKESDLKGRLTAFQTAKAAIDAQMTSNPSLRPALSTSLQLIEKQMKEAEVELTNLQAARAKQQAAPLPDTPEKVRLRQKMETRETEFLSQTKIAKFVRFSDLENSRLREGCLEKLKEPDSNTGSVRPHMALDAWHETLLQKRFREELFPRLCALKLDHRKELLNRLERSVLSKSYIYFLTNVASGELLEVGDFLHLPEMDSKVVGSFDTEIAKQSVDAVISSIVLGIDLEFYQNQNNQFKSISPSDSQRIHRKVQALVEDVKLLLGKELPKEASAKDKASAEIQEWKNLQKEHQDKYESDLAAINRDYTLPAWKKFLMGIPFGVPLILHNQEWERKKEEKRADHLRNLKQEMALLETQVDQWQEIFALLKRIQVMVEKRHDLDAEFHKIPISLVSSEEYKASVKNRISRVRDKYGHLLWDQYVEEWVTRIFPKDSKITWSQEEDELLDSTLQRGVPFLVGTLFDPSITWHCKWNDQETVYSWHDFEMEQSIFSQVTSGIDAPLIQLQRFQAAFTPAEAQFLKPELLMAFRIIWNEYILPRLGDLAYKRSPLTLAMLGAVLLKKWEK